MLNIVILCLMIAVVGCQNPHVVQVFQQVVVPDSGEVLCIFPRPLIDCNLHVSDQSIKKLFKQILDFGGGLLSQRVTLTGRRRIQAYASYAGKGLDKGHCGVRLEMVQPGLVVLVECNGQYANNIWRQGYGLLASDDSNYLASSTQTPIFEVVEPGSSLSVLLTANVPLDWCSVYSPSAGMVDLSNGLSPGSRYSAHGAGIDQGECGVSLNNLAKGDSGVWFWEAGVGSDDSKTLQAVIVLVEEAPVTDPILDVPSLNSLQAGDWLLATCEPPPAAPPAEIVWILNGKEINAGELNEKLSEKWPWEPQSEVQTLKHLLDAADNGKKLECVMEHSALSGGPRSVSEKLHFVVPTTTAAPDICSDAKSENLRLTEELKKIKLELTAARNTIKNEGALRASAESIATQAKADLGIAESATATAEAARKSAESTASKVKADLATAQSVAASAEKTCNSVASIASQLKTDMSTVKAATASVGAVCKSAENVASQAKADLATAKAATSIADAAREIAEKIVSQATSYLATVQSATVSAEAARQSAVEIVTQATAYLVSVQSAPLCADPAIVSKLKADLATAQAANFIADVARKSAINMASQAASDVITAQAATLSAETARKTAESVATKATADLVAAQAAKATAETATTRCEAANANAESATVTAETARKTAEGVAAKATADLVAAQAATSNAEAARKSAEGVAAKATADLVAAQAATANAKAATANAEAATANAEAATSNAEAARKSAESISAQAKNELYAAQRATATAEAARKSAESIAAQAKNELYAAQRSSANADAARNKPIYTIH